VLAHKATRIATRAIGNPMTGPPAGALAELESTLWPRTIQRIVPGRPTPPGSIVGAPMRTLVAALVLATATLAGAQV